MLQSSCGVFDRMGFFLSNYFVGRVFGLVLSLAGVAVYGLGVRRSGASEYVPQDAFVLGEVAPFVFGIFCGVFSRVVVSFGAPGRASQTIPFLFLSRP